jgi:Uma2 family endonuclease
MPETLEQNPILPHRTEVFYPSSTGDEPITYPEQREDDMGETSVHINLVANFLNILKLFFKERKEVFLSANMNLYYEKDNPNKWFAPDILIAFGVPNHERSSYQIWEENVAPQVIFEVSSERTWKIDVSEKLEIYAQLGVEEYYILDPEFAYLPAPIMAFHRSGDRLLTTPVNDERILSPRLGLEIVRTENNFRLFDPGKNEFLRTLDEAESELERLRSEIERLKAEK